MDCKKVGDLIRCLRKEKKLTQKQLADKMNISDKTISKWERGLGCPDVSLLNELSNCLQVNIEENLSGNLTRNDFVGGNMKKSNYYSCPSCKNITISTGDAMVSCCGRKLEPLVLQIADANQKLKVEQIEDYWYITSDHPMTKDNYITFVALVNGAQLDMMKQYPEWNMAIQIKVGRHGMLVWHDMEKDLFYQLL